jgi:hypothetical protein
MVLMRKHGVDSVTTLSNSRRKSHSNHLFSSPFRSIVLPKIHIDLMWETFYDALATKEFIHNQNCHTGRIKLVRTALLTQDNPAIMHLCGRH